MIINFQQRLYEKMKTVALDRPAPMVERQQVGAAQPPKLSDDIKKQLGECFHKMHFALADLHELQGQTIRAASDNAAGIVSGMINDRLEKNPMNPALHHLNEISAQELDRIRDNKNKFPEFDVKSNWASNLSDKQKNEKIKSITTEFEKQKMTMENIVAGRAQPMKLSPEMQKQMAMQMATWKMQQH